MKFITTFIIIFTILYGDNTYYEHKVSQFQQLSKQADKKIVMLGDSITDRGLWCELTNRKDIINRGISGDTTSGVLNRLDSLNNKLKLAFVMIGINDLLKGESVEYVFGNYKKIIIILRDKNIKPIIQSTLYVGKNAPKLYNEKVEQLNNLLQKYAAKKQIKYIDLNKELAPNSFLLQKYSWDGLHLNGQGYFQWVRIIQKLFNG